MDFRPCHKSSAQFIFSKHQALSADASSVPCTLARKYIAPTHKQLPQFQAPCKLFGGPTPLILSPIAPQLRLNLPYPTCHQGLKAHLPRAQKSYQPPHPSILTPISEPFRTMVFRTSGYSSPSRNRPFSEPWLIAFWTLQSLWVIVPLIYQTGLALLYLVGNPGFIGTYVPLPSSSK